MRHDSGGNFDKDEPWLFTANLSLTHRSPYVHFLLSQHSWQRLRLWSGLIITMEDIDNPLQLSTAATARLTFSAPQHVAKTPSPPPCSPPPISTIRQTVFSMLAPFPGPVFVSELPRGPGPSNLWRRDGIPWIVVETTGIVTGRQTPCMDT
ncbi:hypothetical protein K491DRAFT_683769 [Lophiostoma macrostomum CBS 122681]|uniref:Uncharacterized protein n=1 Tax=Lophiostoma macrostomum CBS 122681 TaxID=1314788 RepID=A0A6A6SSZ6_9PLEO|nr:hypothetical protein K491DRAFT_683769 [Lophiostoma macrostomum CBS 122681]